MGPPGPLTSVNKTISITPHIKFTMKWLTIFRSEMRIIESFQFLPPPPPPPCLVGAYYLQPPHAQAIFLQWFTLYCHVLCNWGRGCITYRGGGGVTNGKDYFQTKKCWWFFWGVLCSRYTETVLRNVMFGSVFLTAATSHILQYNKKKVSSLLTNIYQRHNCT